MDANFITPKELRERMSRLEKLIETPMGVTEKQSLVEAKGWKEIVADISGDDRKMFVASMLESNREMLEAKRNGGFLTEDTQSIQVGNWEKFGFPVISMVAENLIAPELVSVQPLSGPSGNIFYMNFTVGQDKGSIKKGSMIWDARGGHGPQREHSSEKIPSEQLAVGDGGTSDYRSSGWALSYTPVRPGTVVVTAGSVIASDDGNGVLAGTGVTTGSINYQTGAIGIQFTGNVANGTPITVDYFWNSEGSTNLPQVNFQIVSSPIYAIRHALRGRWSIEAEQMLQALHGLKAEAQLSAAISAEIQFEIDRLVLQNLWNTAGAGNNQWDATKPAGVSFTEHKLSFVDAINECSMMIYRATSRVMANWVVTGVQGASILINHPLFEAATTKTEVDGITFLGTLNKQYKVYVDPHTAPDEYLVGHKSENWMRTGFVFAPWLLLYSTNTIALDDLTYRKGFASSFGLKAVNTKYYAKGKVTNYPVNFTYPDYKAA